MTHKRTVKLAWDDDELVRLEELRPALGATLEPVRDAGGSASTQERGGARPRPR